MSKREKEIEKLFDKTIRYKLDEAIDILQKAPKTKFDQTVEIHIKLGIDPKKSDQIVRGAVVLPAGIGKTRKIAVIAKGEKLKEAEESGADFVGSDELIEKISKGWFDFDVLVATPDSMKDLSKLGKILGPKGLMPNPKSGTVTFDLKKTVQELKTGRVEFRNDEYGIIHAPVGKLSFEKEKLTSNIKTFVEAVIKSKPPAAKGQFIKGITLSSSMGPGIKVDIRQI